MVEFPDLLDDADVPTHDAPISSTAEGQAGALENEEAPEELPEPTEVAPTESAEAAVNDMADDGAQGVEEHLETEDISGDLHTSERDAEGAPSEDADVLIDPPTEEETVQELPVDMQEETREVTVDDSPPSVPVLEESPEELAEEPTPAEEPDEIPKPDEEPEVSNNEPLEPVPTEHVAVEAESPGTVEDDIPVTEEAIDNFSATEEAQSPHEMIPEAEPELEPVEYTPEVPEDIPSVEEPVVADDATVEIPADDAVDEDPAPELPQESEAVPDVVEAPVEESVNLDEQATEAEVVEPSPTNADEEDPAPELTHEAEAVPDVVETDSPVEESVNLAEEATEAEVIEPSPTTADDEELPDDTTAAPEEISEPGSREVTVDEHDSPSADADLEAPAETPTEPIVDDAAPEEIVGEAVEMPAEVQETDSAQVLDDDTLHEDVTPSEHVIDVTEDHVAEESEIEAAPAEELHQEAPEEVESVEDPAVHRDAIELPEEEIAEPSAGEALSEEPLPEPSDMVEETVVAPESVESPDVEDASIAEAPALLETTEREVTEEPEVGATPSEAIPEETTDEPEVAEMPLEGSPQVEEPLAVQEELVEDIVPDSTVLDATTNEQETVPEPSENPSTTETEGRSDALEEPVEQPVLDAPIDASPEEPGEPEAEETGPGIGHIESSERETEEPFTEERVISEGAAHAEDPLESVEEPVISENVEDDIAEPCIPEDEIMEESHDFEIPEESPEYALEEPVDASPIEEVSLDDIPEYLPLPPEVDTSLNVFDDVDDAQMDRTEDLAAGEQEEPIEHEDLLDQIDAADDRSLDEEDESAQVDSEIPDDILEPETVESITEPPIDDEEFEASVIEAPQEETENLDASDPFESAAEDMDGGDQGSFAEESENEMASDDMGFPPDLAQSTDFLPSEVGDIEPVADPAENHLDDDYVESQEVERDMAGDDMGTSFAQNTDVDEEPPTDATAYHEEDSAQESDASLVAVDTPQTPISPISVHQPSVSYTEMLLDADDETVERSIQDDLTAHEPVSTDFEEGLPSVILCS